MDTDRVSKRERSSKHSSSSSKKSSKHRSRDESQSPPRLDESFKRKHLSDESEEDERHYKRSATKDDRSKKHRNEEKSKREKEVKPDESTNAGGSGGGAGNDELSIEETNKLREKLGLKPLTVTDPNKPVTEVKTASGQVKKTYLDKDTNQEFEHVPAKNLAEIKEQKTLREKLKQKREQRELSERIDKSKGIADSDDEEKDDSAAAWLQKIKEKQEAQKKAKLLEEMDEQFGDGELVDTSSNRSKQNRNESQYGSKNLKGLRVEHDQALFQEGKDIILTLKDRNILQGEGEDLDVDNDEDADVLINVNIADDERFSKNVENKKKKPGYSAYEEFDDEGLFKEKTILDKYNEELNGEVKKSFKLDAKGTYDASDQKFLQKLDEEHRAKAIRIDALNELKAETDYYTPTELEKFKKPKKIRKVLRKSKKEKMIKADDLLPLPNEIKSENTEKRQRIKEEEGWVKNEPKTQLTKKAPGSISLKNVDFGFDKDEESEQSSEDSDNESETDGIQLNQNELKDYQEMADEEANALDELQSILSKTRKRLTNTKKVGIDELVKVKEEEEKVKLEAKLTDDMAFEAIKTIDEDIYLDSMSEFCKNLGQVSNKEEKSQIIGDEEDEKEMETGNQSTEIVKEIVTEKESQSDSEEDEDAEMMNKSNSTENNAKADESDEEFELLEDEVQLDRGLASFLHLCKDKGFIETEKRQNNSRIKKEAIEAVNYTVEEKNYYDIDDKYNRNRDRFGGPTSDFHEKSNYKPNVKLDYIDEKGHSMNEKEAFRYLSHKFHGKGSGKKKTEKQQNKYKEKDIMAKMSLVDTPLNTVAMLVDKQKKLQQPYVVLSATKNKEQVTLNKR